MKDIVNSFKAEIPALSINEGYARMLCAVFVSQLDPTVEELADIKTAVSEAVTNCIVHAYKGQKDRSKKIIYIQAQYNNKQEVKITIKDKGCGIENISRAMQPLYTTDPQSERTGMGFCIMESFMDKLKVTSKVGAGTKIVMYKKIKNQENVQ